MSLVPQLDEYYWFSQCINHRSEKVESKEVQSKENVIRRISEYEASLVETSTTKKIVIIDKETREVLDKKSLFTFGRKLDFFVVSNENYPRNLFSY